MHEEVFICMNGFPHLAGLFGRSCGKPQIAHTAARYVDGYVLNVHQFPRHIDSLENHLLWFPEIQLAGGFIDPYHTILIVYNPLFINFLDIPVAVIDTRHIYKFALVIFFFILQISVFSSIFVLHMPYNYANHKNLQDPCECGILKRAAGY